MDRKALVWFMLLALFPISFALSAKGYLPGIITAPFIAFYLMFRIEDAKQKKGTTENGNN